MNDRRPHPTRPMTGARTVAGRRAAVVRGGREAILAMATALAVASCAGVREEANAVGVGLERSDTLEARLGPLGGTAAKGTVRFASSANGLTTSVFFFGVAPGNYRMAIHATGNCTSPNGFSAGPPWVPPDAKGPIVIEFSVDNNNPTSLSQRVAGLALNGSQGVAGRAVVIHQGRNGTLEAEPDRPNDRVACGVIGAVFRYF
jgi:Cu/Zn superoxide dismutase